MRSCFSLHSNRCLSPHIFDLVYQHHGVSVDVRRSAMQDARRKILSKDVMPLVNCQTMATIRSGRDLGLGPPVACRILSLFGASVSVANRDQSGIRLTLSLKHPAPNCGDSRTV